VRRRSLTASVLLVVVLCLGCGGLSFWSRGKATPYEGSLRELFGNIRQSALDMKSCQLEFEVKVSEGEATRVRRGTAWLRGISARLEEEISYRFAAQGRGVSREVRVSDGRESWVYRTDEGVATVQPLLAQTREALVGRVARYGPLALVQDVPGPGPNLKVEEVGTRKGKQFRIETRYEDASGQGAWMKRTTWVDARDFLVRRIEIEGARPEKGELVHYQRSQRYWGYESNPDISDDRFQFTPPPGTRIQRLTPR